MALPSTGSISMSQVRSELGLSGSISLGQSEVRALAGRSSGSISMSHLRGKSAWGGTLDNLPSLITHTRFSVGASNGIVSLYIRGIGTFLANEARNATMDPPMGSSLDQLTGQRWDSNDAATRAVAECKFTLLGVTNHQGSTGLQGITTGSEVWNAIGNNRNIFCEIPRFYNENSYKFNLSIRSSESPSNIISKDFTLRITNSG